MHVYRRSHSFVTANCFKTTVFFPHFIVLCVRISFRSLFYQPLKIISKICAAIFVICSFYMCIYFQLKIEHLIVFFLFIGTCSFAIDIRRSLLSSMLSICAIMLVTLIDSKHTLFWIEFIIARILKPF